MGTNAEYAAAMQASLSRWDALVAALVAEGRNASGEARTAYDRRIKQLRLARNAAQRSLQTLRAANESAGRQLQAGMDDTWGMLQGTLDEVTSDLRKPPTENRAPTPQESTP